MTSFRMSPQQRRLWALEDRGLAERGASYNGVCAVALPAGVEPDVLRSSIAAVVARHEALRTRFESRPGLKVPFQVVAEEGDFDWDRVEGVDWRRVATAELTRRRDVFRWPLRARLVTAAEAPVLVLAVPSLCADLWSLGNMAEDLARLHGGEELPEVLQYPRYAAFQNDLAEEEDDERAEALAHWRRVFEGGASPGLPLPMTPPPGGVPFVPDAGAEIAVDGPALEGVAGRAGVGPEPLLVGLWAAYLARLAGGETTVGHLVDGRDYEVLQAVVGLLARVCPLHVVVDAGTTPETLAVRTATVLEEAAEWADHLDPGAFVDADDGPPYFDALFQSDRRWPRVETEETGFDPLWSEAVAEPFLVRLALRWTDGGPHLELSHDPQRLDATAALRLRRGFAVFLAAALESPQRPVVELPLLTADESRRLLTEVFRGDAPAPAEPPPPVSVRIAAAARRAPEAPALIVGGESLSRGELAQRTARLAGRLRALGVGPEVVVGLCCERSADLVVALVAVLQAGGAYLPLDPELPPARRDALLAAAGAELLISHRGLVPAPPDGCRILDLDDPTVPAGDVEPLPTPVAVDGASLAYVLFTSGSTGTPKGVAVERRQLAAYQRAVEERLALPETEDLTFAMVSTPAADLGNTVLFTALCGGGPLLLVDAETAADPASLADLFAGRDVDVLKIVPSHLAALLAGGGESGRLLPRRLLVCGGETLEPSLVERVRSLAPDLRIVNHYGPTETTVGVLTWEVETDGATATPHAASVPLGRPLAGCLSYVLDPRFQPVPVGLDGELFLGGTQVARGYHRQPGLTAAAFLPDPYAAEAGARVYRSGDLARVLPEDVIEFRGRRDEQVKVRGFRVEPGEVARRLEDHPEVGRAVVTARDDGAGGPRLVAYVETGARGEGDGVETLPNGLRVHGLNRNETRHLYRQIFVDRIYDRHGTVYADGACIFDVGANVGMFSLFAHLRCRRPKIFAFEPSPPAFERLRENVRRHGVDAHLYGAGVADREGSAELTVYPRASVMSGFHADAEAEEALFRAAFSAEGHGDGLGEEEAAELAAGRFRGERLVRPLTTVSAVIQEHGVKCIDLLKVDAEKSELEVLEGIEEEDWPKIRQILLEVHALDDRVERVRRLLTGQGYRVVVEEDPALAGTGIFHVHASRLPESGCEPPPPLAEVAPPVELSAEGLREMLRRTLPDYMVPAAFVFLDRLPLNRNGKVDRSGLPAPEEAAAAGYVPPSTPVERRLCGIWCDVLRRERVGVDDNFFELGGDSILSIQVAAQARRAGLQLATRQLFQHQTIRELATAVGELVVPPEEAEQGVVAGPVPATPIQRWFYGEGFAEPHHFNQTLLLAVRERLDPVLFHRAVGRVTAHHDALRLRCPALGEQEIVATAATPCTCLDLTALPAERRPAAVTAAAAALQASLDLAAGPVARFALFDFGDGVAGRLLTVVHHLVMDGVSWRFLLADLETAYRDLAAGREVRLPAKTTSLPRWARRLEQHAATDEVGEELPFWLAQTGAVGLPPDVTREDGRAGRVESLSRHLGEERTRALLTEVPTVYQAQVPELLLAALAAAVAHRTGVRDLGVTLEGHGREDLFEDLDVSRTLGWLTTHYPVRLETPSGSGAGDLLKAVKERLRQAPRGGIGYGLLRYLAPPSDGVAELRGRPAPNLKFNYLGRLDQVLPDDSPFAVAVEDRGPDRSLRGHRPYPVEVDAAVVDGRLQTVWAFDPGRHRRDTVEGLAVAYLDELDRLIEHCLSGEDAGYSPSDFPLADLEQASLEEALSEADFEMRGES